MTQAFPRANVLATLTVCALFTVPACGTTGHDPPVDAEAEGETPAQGGSGGTIDAARGERGGHAGSPPEHVSDAAVLPQSDAAIATAKPDAAADGGLTVVCNPNARWLCDDFETTAIDTAQWKVEIGGASGNANTLTVDTARVHGGKRALHLHAANKRDDGVRLVVKKPLVPLGNVVYGRVWLYLAAPAPVRHISLFAASGNVAAGGSAEYRYGIETQRLMANYYTGSRDDGIPTNRFFDRKGQTVPYTAPTNRWVCTEWLFDGNKNELRYWQDNIEVAELHRMPSDAPTWPAPTFNRLWIGWQMYGEEEAAGFDLWFDDVAIDKARIGCP
ncbi:MAG: hypothetical protein SF187_01415 [Deltaproteobacteria bacterium]|nr:hypothetical protein [Deltaproteobacteria bacterium]